MNIENEKEPEVNKNKNRNIYFCVAYSCYFSKFIHKAIERQKNIYSISAESKNVLP